MKTSDTKTKLCPFLMISAAVYKVDNSYAKCKAEECMMWKWVDGDDGYCGLKTRE